jgi:predicted aspartyl protease
MAQVYPLKLVRLDHVILTDVLINTHSASLVFDTGATHTIIDLNTLLIAGYSFVSIGKKEFETANGIVNLDMIHLKSLKVWQTEFNNIDVYTLDFIEAGIMSPYEGVLGLDIMKAFCITMDFKNQLLKIE